ncbi:MAG: FAD/FMN-containing dehydrogenases, partial [uncultured Corynebacteriales bacterium]
DPGRRAARRRRRPRGGQGAVAGAVRGHPGGGAGPAGQAHLQPLPAPVGHRDPGPGRVRTGPGAVGGPGSPHRRRPGHDDVRAAGGRDARARPDADRGAAAEDHHPRRGGDRARHRVQLVPRRAAARGGAGDRGAHRGRRGGHRHPDQRARRPLPRLPQLLRDAGLRAADGDRPGAGPAVRAAAARPLRTAVRAGRCDRGRHAGRGVGRGAGRLPGRRGVHRGRGVPHARVLGGHGTVHIGLHRRAHLLPVGAGPAGGPPDRPGLPVALGHRLVLVLPRVRRAEPADPAGVAQALAAQRRLLEAHPAGEPLPRGGPDRPVAGPAGPRAAGPGRGDPAGADRRVPRLVPAGGPGRAGVAVPAAAAAVRPGRRARRRRDAVAPLPPRRRRGVRQRRLLVDGAHPARRGRRRRQPYGRAGGRGARRPQVALLRRVLRRGALPRALRRAGLRGGEGPLRPRREAVGSLREGGDEAM